MKYSYCTRAYITLVVILISGCTTVTPQVNVSPAPIIISSANDIRNHINRRASQIITLKASGTMTIHEPDVRPYTYPVVVMFKQPNKFYLKASKQLTPTLFNVISANDHFYIFLPQDNIIYTGNNKTLRENADYDVSLTPEFIAEALFALPIPAHTTATLERSNTVYTVSLFETYNGVPVLTRKIGVDVTTLACVEELFYAFKGYTSHEIKRNNYQFDKEQKMQLAHSVMVRNITHDVAIQLEFKKIIINDPIDDETFEFRFPEGVDVEDIG